MKPEDEYEVIGVKINGQDVDFEKAESINLEVTKYIRDNQVIR